MCGDALNTQCAAGVFVYCECLAREGTPCAAADQSGLYQLCYHEDPNYAPGLLCLAPYAELSTFDCEEASLTCS
jgi:hypothetical protein